MKGRSWSQFLRRASMTGGRWRQTLPFLILAALSGCVRGSGNSAGYYQVRVATARFYDVQRGNPEPTSVFYSQDIVVAILRNISKTDQTGLVEFVNASNSQVVFTTSVACASGMVRMASPYKPLPAGNYLVRVTGVGPPVLHLFAVVGR
jgi:hypothetical protein